MAERLVEQDQVVPEPVGFSIPLTMDGSPEREAVTAFFHQLLAGMGSFIAQYSVEVGTGNILGKSAKPGLHREYFSSYFPPQIAASLRSLGLNPPEPPVNEWKNGIEQVLRTARGTHKELIEAGDRQERRRVLEQAMDEWNAQYGDQLKRQYQEALVTYRATLQAWLRQNWHGVCKELCLWHKVSGKIGKLRDYEERSR